MLIVLSILIMPSRLIVLIVLSGLSMLIVLSGLIITNIARLPQRAERAQQAQQAESKLSKLRGGGSMQSGVKSACNQGDNQRTACACVHR